MAERVSSVSATTTVPRSLFIEENYTIVKKLGKGQFGEVKEVLKTGTQQRFAWKQVTSEQDPYYEVEAQILRDLHHDGIVSIVEAYSQDGVVDMVLELCQKSLQFDMDSRLEPAPMTGKKQYMRPRSCDIASTMEQLLAAVYFLHENGVSHRDIKPDNVLMSVGGTWKLADFGLATRFNRGSYMTGEVGTQPFMAPEVEQRHYTEKCDIYSMGVLFIALTIGKQWWRPESLEDDEAKEQAKQILTLKTWKEQELSAGALEFAKRMVSSESERGSAEDALKNPWLQKLSSQADGVVDMVLELCQKSLQFDMDSRLEPAPMTGKKQYMRPRSCDIASTMEQLLAAVYFLHENGVSHRDIKPDNVLMSASGTWKLADFGLATRFNRGSYMTGEVGTQPFMAPEVEQRHYTEKCDIYSMGVLFIALATGKQWWRPESLEDKEAQEKARQLLTLRTWKDLELGHGALEFAKRMVSLESERGSAEDALKNPWLVQKVSSQAGCCAIS
ncbi:unnamed protein product [Durusdinium trenchii]|uniref:Protein kinase domain-containing protein n=1 Tax=Durusdinium trenchii TaxID=1381693 RepID=A0ABP0IEC2_9DINO